MKKSYYKISWSKDYAYWNDGYRDEDSDDGYITDEDGNEIMFSSKEEAETKLEELVAGYEKIDGYSYTRWDDDGRVFLKYEFDNGAEKWEHVRVVEVDENGVEVWLLDFLKE